MLRLVLCQIPKSSSHWHKEFVAAVKDLKPKGCPGRRVRQLAWAEKYNCMRLQRMNHMANAKKYPTTLNLVFASASKPDNTSPETFFIKDRGGTNNNQTIHARLGFIPLWYCHVQHPTVTMRNFEYLHSFQLSRTWHCGWLVLSDISISVSCALYQCPETK